MHLTFQPLIVLKLRLLITLGAGSATLITLFFTQKLEDHS